MADVSPDQIPKQKPNPEVGLERQYMPLNEATRSPDVTETKSKTDLQSSEQTSQYAPLHPSTRSWEIPRKHVTIEKIIGKGAFGQVAKATAKGLRGRPQKTLVAVKMLKGIDN